MRIFFSISTLLLHLLITTTATSETTSSAKSWKSSSSSNGVTTTTFTISTNGGPAVTTTFKDVGYTKVTTSPNVGPPKVTASTGGGPPTGIGGPPTVGPPEVPASTDGGPPADIDPPDNLEMITSKGKENQNQKWKPSEKGSRAYQFMAPQNEARAGVGEKPLVWDEKLASYARWWANQRKGDCNMEHSQGPYGENVYWGGSNVFTPADAAKAWVAEKKCYHHDHNSCDQGEQCGHYTQIVWKTSSKVGCAKVTCDSGKGVFMVCEYDPPGNYVGVLPY